AKTEEVNQAIKERMEEAKTQVEEIVRRAEAANNSAQEVVETATKRALEASARAEEISKAAREAEEEATRATQEAVDKMKQLSQSAIDAAEEAKKASEEEVRKSLHTTEETLTAAINLLNETISGSEKTSKGAQKVARTLMQMFNQTMGRADIVIPQETTSVPKKEEVAIEDVIKEIPSPTGEADRGAPPDAVLAVEEAIGRTSQNTNEDKESPDIKSEIETRLKSLRQMYSTHKPQEDDRKSRNPNGPDRKSPHDK
ncbi:MAG: hypothetical protein U9Q31_00180, partial [Chloroflexota bacterium]|nr:hypothetical protein [Chloroflexota bacterium]